MSDCPANGPTSAGIYMRLGPVDVHSNPIDGGVGCATGANVYEVSPTSAPVYLENNAFVPPSIGTNLYRDDGGIDAMTADQINAIPGLITSGNFVAACVLPLDAASACVDTGTPTGAPAFDAEDDARSALTPDVGPDEWGDL